MLKFQLSSLGGVAFLLTACGGGGGENNNTTPTQPITPPTCTATQYLENNVCKDKSQQTLSGLSLPTTINVDRWVTLNVKSSAGLTPTYISKTEETCKIRDDLKQKSVEMLGLGVCTIEVSQAGNTQVLAAQPISVSTTILPVLTTTGIHLCGTDDKNNLPCDNTNLVNLFGMQQDGEKQAGRKMAYELISYNNENCIRDQVTGLIWEQKTKDKSLRDQDWRFTWYNADPKNNAGDAGIQASSTTCNGTLSSCNTTAYIEALNKANYCGYSDWRLPTRSELTNLVDYSTSQAALNPIYTNTTFSDGYWSSTSSAKQNTKAWTIDFKEGASNPTYKEYMAHIRAVRTPQ